jgi:hypothetical protein
VICFLSVFILTICAFVFKAKQREIWPAFKREVYLVLGTIASVVVLHLCLVSMN